MNDYIARVSENLAEKYAHEPEYLQCVNTWLDMIAPAAEDPRYEKLDLITRMVEPERMFTFLIPWVDDRGVTHTNHGYRVQFNSAIGPYKGGLRFHPGVTASVVKFLGFEQTYKNALTGLPIGGAAGGADFDPRGKSNREIMRFCQSFMYALYRYIGADTDVPAGDIGVGSREVGWLYGAYKKVTGRAQSSALTGKGLTYGGSRIRQEAAGFGTVYFLARMLEHQGATLEGKRLIVSGFGNMSWGVCRKAAELGAKVVTLSGPDGYIFDGDGVATQEKYDFLVKMRYSGEDRVEAYAERFGTEFAEAPAPESQDSHGGGQGQRQRRRGGVGAGDGPERRALQLVPPGGGREAAAYYERHLRCLRSRRGGLRSGVRSYRRQRHRRLPAHLRSDDRPRAVISPAAGAPEGAAHRKGPYRAVESGFFDKKQKGAQDGCGHPVLLS